MASDPHRSRFLMQLIGVSASVMCLILANNLILAFVGWQGISYGIFQLLTHYKDRPQAMAAARHKYLLTSFGNLCFILAIVIGYITVGSSHYNALPQSSQSGWIALLLVLAVMTKASLFPFHRWLPNTLETPTPVSALMHAGVINAGGFLLIRLIPLLQAHLGVMIFLTIIGALTALIGGLHSLVQASVKKRLAYSTVSQMGFMCVQYGLGSPLSALFHLFSHGLYKATAFLDSGNGLTRKTATLTPDRGITRFTQTLIAGLGTFLILTLADRLAPLSLTPVLTAGMISLSIFQWLKGSLTGTIKQILFGWAIAFGLTLEFAWVLHAFRDLLDLTTVRWLSDRAQVDILIGIWTLQLLLSLLPMSWIQNTRAAHIVYPLIRERHYV
jgi:NAD(P)H-quinone oxidoreductase subunit 5